MIIYNRKTNIVLEVEKWHVNYDVHLKKQVFIILKAILKEEERRLKHWPKNSFCGEINGIDFFSGPSAAKKNEPLIGLAPRPSGSQLYNEVGFFPMVD